MSVDIAYPYIPSGKSFRFVNENDKFMLEAALARKECAGDRLYPVGAVLVKNGRIITRAGNGYNKGPGLVHVCPRIVLECPSGVGYDLCTFHDSPGHVEQMVIASAKNIGIDPVGSDIYIYGHWWCCESCWGEMMRNKIRDVYLVEGANEKFSRERVYKETLRPKVKSAYIAGAYTHNIDFESDKADHQAFGDVCEKLGCSTVIPFRDNPEAKKSREARDTRAIYQWVEKRLKDCDMLIADVSCPSLGAGGELTLAKTFGKPIVLISKKGSIVSTFARGNPAVVYHVEYETLDQGCRMLKNVIIQL